MNAIVFPLAIYYDSACALCNSEMTTLARLDGGGRLKLIDCAGGVLDKDARAAGFTAEDLLGVIRARDAEGRWLAGVDVFVVAYRAAGLRTLAWMFGQRHLRIVWDRAYPWIARNRYALSKLGLAHVFRLLPHRPSHATNACDSGTCALRD
jgi:predicted DCC family thiol-disulfide oxidoreductase YuxK